MSQRYAIETTRSMPRGGVLLPSIGRVHHLYASQWNQQLGRWRD